MVKLWCSAAGRIRVPARPARHVHRRVPDVRHRTRRNASTLEGGTPDMTIGHADADQAGARPYLHRCAGTRSGHATHVQRRARERISYAPEIRRDRAMTRVTGATKYGCDFNNGSFVPVSPNDGRPHRSFPLSLSQPSVTGMDAGSQLLLFGDPRQQTRERFSLTCV